MERYRSGCGWLVVGVLVFESAAWAQTEATIEQLGGDRPWAEGVSEAQQETARALFYEGNAHLKDSLLNQALDKYEEALVHWDHPGIHYNMALALLSLDKPIEVYEHLTKALEHGAVPLAPLYQQARDYLALVGRQLAHIEVICREADAKITLDGKLIWLDSGRYQGLVRIGEHHLVASKPGHLTASRSVVLESGTHAQVEMALYTLEEVTESRRQWDPRLPIAVIGAGIVMSMAGGLSQWRANTNYRQFDAQYSIRCPEGCADDDAPEILRDLRYAQWQQRIAFGAYVAGGFIVTTGIAMIYLNRPRLVRIEMPESPVIISVDPVLIPDFAGVRAGIQF